MTTATAPAVEKRKKPWTKARVIDLIIDIFCFVIVGAASLTCILPFIHILAKSLSDNAYVVANRVILLPMSDAGINLDAYNKVFHDPTIMQSLWVTALVTVVFTAIGMFLTVCASYALTRPEFHGRKVFTFMIMFTMYFTAGTIPDYLLMNQLHMLDTIWCLILPLCFAPYNLLIMKNNFQGSIPESLIESARLDGASHFTILAKIVVPLSKPIMATIALFYAVGRWNAYSDALYYIKQNVSLRQRQIVKDFLIKFTKNLQKRCQKHCMAPDTSFDRLHFSVQQVFAEIRIVWQLVDIWLPAPLDFGQFQRIGFLQCMIVACHI